MVLLSSAVAVAGLLGACDAFELRPFAKVVAETPEFFNSGYYLALYCLFWSFLIEISLLNMQLGKTSRFFIENHLLINSVVVLGQLGNDIYLGGVFDLGNTFRLLSAVLILLQVGQIFMGQKLSGKLKLEELPRNLFAFKQGHSFVGYTLYLSHKAMTLIYASHYAELNPDSAALVCAQAAVIGSASFQLIVSFYAKTGNFQKWDISKRKRPEHLSTQKHIDVLQNLSVGDFEQFVEETFRISLTEGASIRDLSEQKKMLRWTLIEDKVIDISSLKHPCGQFVLAKSMFKDITREMYGLKSFHFENRREQLRVPLKHKHYLRTFLELQNHCFGEIDLGDLLVDKRGTPGFKTTLEDPNVIESRLTELYADPKTRASADWRVERIYSSTFSLLCLVHSGEHVMVNVTNYWLKNFGKYFLMKRSDGSALASFVSLAFSPKYLSLKKVFYASLDSDFTFLHDSTFADGDSDAVRRLVTLVSATQAGAPRLSLQNRDVHDRGLPLLQNTRHGIREAEVLTLVGPLGLGVGFDKNTSKRILIVASDEGVFPFVDCVEFLSQKALIECLDESVSHPVFGNEYRYTYANEIRLHFCIFVSPGFATQARTLLLNALSLTHLLYSHPRGENAKKIIRQVTVISSASELRSDNYTLLESHPQDFNSLSTLVGRLVGEENFDRLIVSGQDDFVTEVLSNCFLPPTEVIIL